jgi:nicotinamide riboside transporter PnuC
LFIFLESIFTLVTLAFKAFNFENILFNNFSPVLRAYKTLILFSKAASLSFINLISKLSTVGFLNVEFLANVKLSCFDFNLFSNFLFLSAIVHEFGLTFYGKVIPFFL